MKHSATLSEARARAPWPLPEPTLTYFPNARFVLSDRDLDARSAGLRTATRREDVLVPDATGGFGHVPVLLERCVALLGPALTRHHPDGSDAVLVDATLGAGGHAERFLTELPGLRLIGIDRDPTALAIARDRLTPFADRITLIHARYDGIGDALTESGYAATESVDAILFDLGVSSMQLDRTERGFSYAHDAPLDMRMDTTSALTAADIVNTYDETALTDILRRYGEERFARRIASHIIRRRARTPFTSTGELVEVVYQAVPAPARRTGGHPAKRTFQALRIAVNGELDALSDALPAALDALATDGRIVVLAYQSLEDRIVKRAFATATRSSSPADLPIELPGHAPHFASLTRGAERADDIEVRQNPRSAAVRLRALQRVQSGHGAARRGGR
jgi:16S rRNA (cytosine1402-N4)-methyltransferase